MRDEFYAKYKKILPAKEAPISEENSMFGYSPAMKDLSVIGPSVKSFTWDDEQFIRHYTERLGQEYDFFRKIKRMSDDDWELL